MSRQLGTKLAADQSPHAKDTSQSAPARPHAALVGLVQRFQVDWEAWPEVVLDEDEKRRTGFVLELHGSHEPGIEHSARGCYRCQRVFLALRAIADWILSCETKTLLNAPEQATPKCDTGHCFAIEIVPM
jgi:hypothetical protein